MDVNIGIGGHLNKYLGGSADDKIKMYLPNDISRFQEGVVEGKYIPRVHWAFRIIVVVFLDPVFGLVVAPW